MTIHTQDEEDLDLHKKTSTNFFKGMRFKKYSIQRS